MKRLDRTRERIAKFTNPAFIQGLREKAVRYRYVPQGSKFSENLLSDPIFQAIAHCQTWSDRIESFEKLTPQDIVKRLSTDSVTIDQNTAETSLKILREWAQNNYDNSKEAFLTRIFVAAVKSGDVETLEKLLKMVKRVKTGRQHKDHWRRIPWHYLFAVNAMALLTNGTIPTKKELAEKAILQRALEEVWHMPNPPLDLRSSDELNRHVSKKIEIYRRCFKSQSGKRQLSRIRKDLDLEGLPSAHR